MDLNLFRKDKGGDPEIIRESQRRRNANVGIVDQIIELDCDWRKRQFELDSLRKDFNSITKEMARSVTEHLKIESQKQKKLIAEKEKEVDKVKDELDDKLNQVGNLVHDSVPVDEDEANNVVVRTWGEPKQSELELKNHVQLVELLGIVDTKNGSNVAGGRGYYMIGDGASLVRGLINYGLNFLISKGYTEITTPYYMRQDVMAKCAQLADFDDELYKLVTSHRGKAGPAGEGDDKYLIATAEQPLCARHLNDWIHPSQLPIRYAGFSTCFRKEAGSHGKDTHGIFRTHQFDKVEQFCITSSNGNDSWDMLEEMLRNSEEFYQTLGLPYRIVSIVSGALNAAAAKKYDLEAWFPASKTFRELVSCSNCTDYQSRKLEVRYGQKKGNDQTKQYVHMLNCTVTAAQRTLCCILENYQKEDGVEIPEVLRPYVLGKTFLPFKKKAAQESK